MVSPYRSVSTKELKYGPIVKDTTARLYVVPLAPPLVVQTTPIALETSLADPEVPFVYIRPEGTLETFFRDTETAVGDACIANKNEWFSIAKTLEDDVLRRGFKSFFMDNGLKLKVPADVACFDAAKKPMGREDLPAGTVVRLVLELSRVCFGRHEYGAAWRVVQVQAVPTTCLIMDDAPLDDGPGPDDSGSDSDINEFL